MVKFTDSTFQDAYLSSLRKHDYAFDSPPPARSRKHVNSSNTTTAGSTTATSSNSEEYTSPLLQRSRERQSERQSFLKDYEGKYSGLMNSSSTVTAAAARQRQEEAKQKKEKEAKKKEQLEIRTTLRTKKLWDLNSPVEEGDDQQQQQQQQRDDEAPNYDLDYDQTSHDRDDDDKNNHLVWNAAQIRRENRRDITKRAKSEVTEMEQFASDMRRRIRHYGVGLAGKREDGSRVVLHEEEEEHCVGGSDEGGGGNGGGNGGGDGGNDRGNPYNIANVGIELRLTRTESSDDIPMATRAKNVTPKKTNDHDDDYYNDDGYNVRQVARLASGERSRKEEVRDDTTNNNGGIDSMIHNFQNTRIKHSPTTRDDELMNRNNSGRAQQQQPARSNQDQARKIASYRGINREDSKDSHDNDDYFSTTSSNDDGSERNNAYGNNSYASTSSPRDARFQRIREMNKKQQHQQQLNDHEPSPHRTSPRPPSAAKKEPTTIQMIEQRQMEFKKAEKMDLDSWWKEHKQRQQREQEGYHEDEYEGDTANMNSSERLESWWRVQRSKKKEGATTATMTPFEELTEEPTIDDTKPSSLRKKGAIGNVVPLLPSFKPPLSPNRTSSRTTPTRTTPTRTSNNQASTSSSTTTSSSMASYRSKNSKWDTPNSSSSNNNSAQKRSGSKSPNNRRQAAGPPCPETPTRKNGMSYISPRTFNNTEDGGSVVSSDERRANSSASKNINNTDNSNNNNEERSQKPPSSIAGPDNTAPSDACGPSSVLSEDESARCQSVAQSTLYILLSRIEEAKINFTKALEDGNVEKQAELAGLMTRLGEAALTMRKLEQI